MADGNRVPVKAIKCGGLVLYCGNILTDELNSFVKKDHLTYLPEDKSTDGDIYVTQDKGICLREWVTYKVESISDDIKFTPNDFIRRGTFGTERYGTLNFKNYMGVAVFKGNKFFIESTKISSEQFYLMLDMVNSNIINLSYDYNQPTLSMVYRNLKKKTDLGYHVYLLIIHMLKTDDKDFNLFSNFAMIASDPHREYVIHNHYKDIKDVSSLNADSFTDILSNLDKLMICGPRVDNKLTKRLTNGNLSYLPYEVMSEDITDTYDNPENRFIKFFLNMCLQILKSFQVKFIEQKEFLLNSLIVKENETYISRLNNILNFSYLNRVGEMQSVPVTSTVLTKKNSYRKMFNYYLALKSLPVTVFNQDKLVEMIENKSLDVIYESFCFFSLANILSDIYGIKRTKIRYQINKTDFRKLLSKRKGSNYFLFEAAGILPTVRLNYSKNYVNPLSYSKAFTPDISLEILGTGNNIREIFLFDAKFRSTFIVDGSSNVDDMRSFKLDDMAKMHAYKDAIVSAKGSFVLYPGDINEIYYKNNFAQNGPLSNSVGAFCLRPGNEDDINYIKNELRRLLEYALEFKKLRMTDKNRETNITLFT